MSATVYGRPGFLSEMSAALHLESGILVECRLSGGDDCPAARLAVFILVFPLARFFPLITVRLNSPQSRQ